MKMEQLKMLIVDDSPQERRTCRDSVVRYQDEKKCQMELVECASVEEALSKLDNSFDGAIIDLKLASQGNEGNEVIRRIVDSQFRIPVAILTGTPDSADLNFSYIGVFKKGEIQYADLLDTFWGIHNTGLTRIMGGRGVIEKNLNQVFLKNLLPQTNTWVAYGKKDPARTEKALLRHTLNHLLQLLDDDVEQCFPEEFYIYPPLTTFVRTGSIIKRKSDQTYFAVLNPACDLVVRAGGKYKTDRLLIAEVDDYKIFESVKGMQKSKNKKERTKIEECTHHHPDSECYKQLLKYQNDLMERSVSGLLRNTHSLYYHKLPKTVFFQGGFLNFRKLTSLDTESFEKEFSLPEIQISSSFIKDIVSRFASYYARQGQPDIDFADLIAQVARA
jgi:CheY-like chemotaxis protein